MNHDPRRVAGWCSTVALALALMGGPAMAQGSAVPAHVKGALQRLQASDPRPWEIAWDREFGQVESLTGRWRGVSPDPDRAATEFLRAFADAFELQPDLADLSVGERRESLTGVHLVFRQVWNGLPVFNGGIDVHVSRGGEVFLVHNRYARAPSLTRVAPTPTLSVRDVTDIVRGAHARLLVPDKSGRQTAPAPLAIAATPELGVWRGTKSLDLAYRVVAGGVRYVVGAHDGAILEQTPLAQHVSVNGTGQIFNPNPVNSLRDTSLRDQSDSNYAALQDAYEIRTLRDIDMKGSPAQFRLIGPHVRMFNATGTFLGNACGTDGAVAGKAPPLRADADFIYARNDTSFEHTNVYFHIDKSQRYIQSLGITSLLNNGIQIDAHAFAADNSYFCPLSGGYLAFGDGGVDDAEDADVVLHEYGHALQHYASGGRYPSSGFPGAMGEGFGDYWAFSAKATGFKPACFAEWDVNNGGCLRRLDTNKRFPTNVVNQVHSDGEIWSQALREIFLRIGKTKADTIILESHFLIALSPTFSKGAKALVDADEQIYGGANKNAICDALIDRGITTPGCGLWIKVSWADVGNDVDLHLRHPDGYDNTGYDYENDCAWYNENPDWGVPDDASDDPLLYLDCVHGCTTEKIVVDQLTTPGLYAVVVHFFSTPNPPFSTNATLEVYQGSKRVFRDSKVITNTGGDADTGEIWFPVDIEVGAAKSVRVNAVGTSHVLPSSSVPLRK